MHSPTPYDRVVITGIGVTASIGRGRESVWRAVQQGTSNVQRLTGLAGIPDKMLLGATVDIEGEFPGQLKNIPLCRQTAAEALADSRLHLAAVDRERFGCSIGAHMGDAGYVEERLRARSGELATASLRQGAGSGEQGAGSGELATASLRQGAGSKNRDSKLPAPCSVHRWWHQWLPNTACAMVGRDYGLLGPRLSNSTACASGTIAILKAIRAIQDGQCDLALAGSSEAIHPLFAAGFYNMGVLAEHVDPAQACRPFDTHRNGFVMGEGAAMFVLERLDHALARRAPIYAEVLGGRILSDARHVTSLDSNSSDSLVELIRGTLRAGRLVPRDIAYVSAHGTGTLQNDVLEARGIRAAFGRAADSVCVSASKSMLGHLVNASGSVELAITALALRDGFAPPTLNLTNPDPACDLDCVPLVGRSRPLEHALKLSIAFGGHLAAIALRRWTGASARAAVALHRQAA